MKAKETRETGGSVLMAPQVLHWAMAIWPSSGSASPMLWLAVAAGLWQYHNTKPM